VNRLTGLTLALIAGAELAILDSIDFTKYDIGAFVIENNQMSPEFCVYLEKRGYECLGRYHLLDEIFVKRTAKAA